MFGGGRGRRRRVVGSTARECTTGPEAGNGEHEPAEPLPIHDGTRGALERGLHRARELGLVQVTEAGMEDWGYLAALQQVRARLDELPVRVRILVASGIADVKRMARSGDPWLELEGRPEGATDGRRVWGTSLHGLFESDGFRAAFLGLAASRSFAAAREQQLDAVADHLAEHLDLAAVDRLLHH